MTAIMPNTIAPEAMNIASFCQKSKLSAKKARYSTVNASQATKAITVPVIRDVRELMTSYSADRIIIACAFPQGVLMNSTNSARVRFCIV